MGCLADQLRTPLFSSQVISHAFWLYFRFPLSLLLVEELLLERGVVNSYDAVRHRAMNSRLCRWLKRNKPSRRDILASR